MQSVPFIINFQYVIFPILAFVVLGFAMKYIKRPKEDDEI